MSDLLGLSGLSGLFDLSGRVALITGGDSGIGASCVAWLQRCGAAVAYTHLPTDTPPSDSTVDPTEGQCSRHPLDLRSASSIHTCVDEVIQRWGQVDVLVNNAGLGTATVSRFSQDRAEQDSIMFDVNARGMLLMTQAVLDRRTADHPLKIINVSSVGGGISQFPGFRLSDGMSKAAVVHLTKQLAAEHVHTHVDVFAICPGATDTPMFQASTINAMSEPERLSFVGRLPKGRLIDPSEIAAVVGFLASAHSQVLHGAVIDCSMGLGVRPGLITEH
jgi:NAD(P)-dependent dehydrogenase (short-subunit alcohol dehydrogenase family)